MEVTPRILSFHPQDGRSITSIVVAAYLLFLDAFRSTTVPLKLFSLKRNPELPLVTGAPSQLRYARDENPMYKWVELHFRATLEHYSTEMVLEIVVVNWHPTLCRATRW